MKNLYKVVIPSAGVGSRIGSFTKFLNKALVTIGDKPAIAHIIDKIPQQVEIVIPVGYKSDYVIQVLLAMFPDRKFSFVKVDKYEGEGSGLGYTLNCAKHLLQCPFVFVPNDTICDIDFDLLDPNTAGNWMMHYQKQKGDKVPLEQYRTVQVQDHYMVDILPKGAGTEDIYIGVCGVSDYLKFWDVMSDKASYEVGEVFALKSLNRVRSLKVDNWFDIGNYNSLSIAKNKYNNPNYNILEKENEAIWFHNGNVFKFHIDKSFISDRTKRTKFLGIGTTPQIIHTDDNVYVYKQVEGKILSKVIDNNTVDLVLNKMESEIWSKRAGEEIVNLKENLEKFYRQKTMERVHYYFNRFEASDKPTIINGRKCPPVFDQLKNLDWDFLYQNAKISRFHGDFHSENILINDQNNVILLDWRQNFGGLGLEFGDVNYDLAKFLHGLLVSHRQVDMGHFSVEKKKNDTLHINILIPFCNLQAISILKNFCLVNGYNYRSVEILTGLIFLNICALHEYPYSEFLFYLGRYLLQEMY